jgi:Thymidylate kinase
VFVAFEGIDGSGKTTTAAALVRELHKRGISAIAVDKRRPELPAGYAHEHLAVLADRLWTTSVGAPIHVLGELHWIYLNAAYFCALWQTTVAPAANQGHVVVVDNWINKFAVRVSTNGQHALGEVLKLINEVPKPDQVFFLDVEPVIAAARRSHFSAHEQGSLRDAFAERRDFVAYQTDVRAMLASLADHCGWHRIAPGTRPAGEVASEIADVISEGLKL